MASANIPNVSDVRAEQNAKQLNKAHKKLENLLTLAEDGVDSTALKSRIIKAQKEVDDLQAAADQAPPAKQPLDKATVEALIDELADSVEEVFGNEADPQAVNELLQAIGLRIVFDGRTRRARGTATLPAPTPSPDTGPLVGASVRVRGGT